MPSHFNAPAKLNWLSGEQKHTWAESKQQFIITKVRSDKSNYEGNVAERHVYTCAPLDRKSGELGAPVELAMTDNSVRLAVAESIVQSLIEDPTGVGPCVLTWATAKVPGGGVWSIESAE